MLDVEGPAAPPRLNGELVFNEPWESRSFAMAMSLVEAGLFTWDDFREHLIEAVQRWEADPDDVYRYYDRWQEALESIVGHQGIVAVSEIEQRATEYELRPPGHDHRHDHGRAHGHGHAHDAHTHDIGGHEIGVGKGDHGHAHDAHTHDIGGHEIGVGKGDHGHAHGRDHGHAHNGHGVDEAGHAHGHDHAAHSHG